MESWPPTGIEVAFTYPWGSLDRDELLEEEGLMSWRSCDGALCSRSHDMFAFRWSNGEEEVGLRAAGAPPADDVDERLFGDDSGFSGTGGASTSPKD